VLPPLPFPFPSGGDPLPSVGTPLCFQWGKIVLKHEVRTTRAVTRTNLGTGKTTRFVDEIREERPQRWKGKRVFIRLLLVYLSVAGVVGLAQFVLMESVKNPSFSLGTCQTLLRSVTDPDERASVIASCDQAFELQQKQAGWASVMNHAIGWVNPITYGVYQSFFDANIQNLAFENQLFQVAAKSDPKPAAKNQTCYTPQVVVFSAPEGDLTKINSALQAYASQGYFIKSSYQTKINGAWTCVFVLERTVSSSC